MNLKKKTDSDSNGYWSNERMLGSNTEYCLKKKILL